MKVSILKVTPAIAKKYLASNTSNRKTNNNQLNMIVRSILAGKWRLTHQGIAFYDDGTLADGQHRLQAIIKTNHSLTMPVFFGVERESDTILAIDCGKGRSVTDSARISGLSFSAADITLAKGLRYGYLNPFDKLTHSEACSLCTEYFDELQIAKKVFSKHKAGITIAPVKVAIVSAVKSGVPIAIAIKFVKTLCTGEYTDSIMVNAVKLRNKLLEKNWNGGSDRSKAYEATISVIRKTSTGEIINRISTVATK